MSRINYRIFLTSILSVVFFFSFFQSSQAGFFDWFRKNDSQSILQNSSSVALAAKQYTFSVLKSGSGIITSDDGKINCGKQCKISYPANSKIVLRAEAANNYKFERWNGCDKVSDGKCQTTLNKSKMIVAKFASKRTSSSSSQKSSSSFSGKTNSSSSKTNNSSISSKTSSSKNSSVSSQTRASLNYSTSSVANSSYGVSGASSSSASAPFDSKVISKIGIVYVSESNETYNANWRTYLYPNKSKIENALNDIFSKKGEKFIVDFIGEFRENNLCWNPNRIAFIQEFADYPNSLEKGWYIKMPGGEISRGTGNYTCLPKYRKTLWSDCDSTRCEEFNHPDFPDSQCFRAKCDQKSFPLSLQDLSWINPLLNNLKSNNLELSNYDYKVIVLGKAGLIIPQTGEKEKQFLCKTMTTGGIMGYASDVIVMAENGLETPSYYKCPDFTRFAMPGWQQIVHEILHKFGAVDVYKFDWQKNPSREEALKLEPESEVDKSVMANGWYGYCNKYGTTYSCTDGDMEKIYLDKYNKIKLGLE